MCVDKIVGSEDGIGNLVYSLGYLLGEEDLVIGVRWIRLDCIYV